MKIKNIHLQNFRGFEQIDINLNNKVNVFIGENGTGKSTVLDAIRTLLSWFVFKISSVNNRGWDINSLDIKNNEFFSRIGISVNAKEYGLTNVSWELSEGLPLYDPEGNNIVDLTQACKTIKKVTRKKEFSLPVIACFSVQRIFNTEKRKSHPFYHGSIDTQYNIELYESALEGKTSFNSFFKWFKEQEDLANERKLSREDWLYRNRPWINNQIKKMTRMKSSNSNDFISHFCSELKKKLEDGFVIDNPKYIFHFMPELLMETENLSQGEQSVHRMARELEYMMLKLSDIYDFEENFDSKVDFFVSTLKMSILHFFELNENMDSQYRSFFWQLLAFATTLNLWWVSEKSLETIGVIFGDYGKILHFHKQLPDKFYDDLEAVLKNEAVRRSRLQKGGGKELELISMAISKVLPKFSNLRIVRKSISDSKRVFQKADPRMMVDKNGSELDFRQLSDGERCFIALIGDIARRLIIANPTHDNPLKGKGIILIDEVDLHLHPQWQHEIIPRLTRTFPNCQFIVSTHSAQVLSNVKASQVFILNANKITKASYSEGWDSNCILKDLMGASYRKREAEISLDKLFDMIQKRDLDKSRKIIEEIEFKFGDLPELSKARILIKRENIRRDKLR